MQRKERGKSGCGLQGLKIYLLLDLISFLQTFLSVEKKEGVPAFCD